MGSQERENYFGEGVAERYDDSSSEMFDPAVIEPTVDFLAGLAGDGAALELGIGTGRVALPLSRRGVTVCGIDLSSAMVEQLRAKPGADRIQVTLGDFATTRVPGEFTLAYLVYNTINNLTTQDDQVTCFQNAAAHLQPGGCFVVEVGVPQLQRLPPGETVRPFTVTAYEARLRRVRHRQPGPGLAPLLDGGRPVPRPVGAVSLRLAGRARPDGEAGRDDAARALERLEAGAVHEREPQAHLGLAEGHLTNVCSVCQYPARAGAPRHPADRHLAELRHHPPRLRDRDRRGAPRGVAG